MLIGLVLCMFIEVFILSFKGYIEYVLYVVDDGEMMWIIVELGIVDVFIVWLCSM